MYLNADFTITCKIFIVDPCRAYKQLQYKYALSACHFLHRKGKTDPLLLANFYATKCVCVCACVHVAKLKI